MHHNTSTIILQEYSPLDNKVIEIRIKTDRNRQNCHKNKVKMKCQKKCNEKRKIEIENVICNVSYVKINNIMMSCCPESFEVEI